jgi:hypothetical protein
MNSKLGGRPAEQLAGRPLRSAADMIHAADTSGWAESWRRHLQPTPTPSRSIVELLRPILVAVVENQSDLDLEARQSAERSVDAGWPGHGFFWSKLSCQAAVEVGLDGTQVVVAPRHSGRIQLSLSARLVPTTLIELLEVNS